MTSGKDNGKSRPEKPPPEPLISMSEKELLEVALWIEIRGAEFFRMVSDNIEEPKLHEFFLRLSGMEMEHEDKIRELLKTKGPARASRTEDPYPRHEYMAQIKIMVEKKVFPEAFEFLVSDLEGFGTPEEALGFAKELEDYAIQLFEFLRDFQLSKESHDLVEFLVKEELKHLEEIDEIMSKIK